VNLPAEVSRWLEQNNWGEVQSSSPVAGGCINQGRRISTTRGRSCFLKLNQDAPAEMFEREAEGLSALALDGAPRVPEVFLVGRQFLLLEDLSPAALRPDYWEAFGRQLACLHNQGNDRFGFKHDNYLGSTPQPNPWTEDGYQFFIEHRLQFQAGLASEHGLLKAPVRQRLDRLCSRLHQLVPPQPASLLHGDLWSGNAIAGPEGEPAIIDPAAHYGWAEAELGMTQLFGGFPADFYQAYQEVHPLEPGWRDRLPIYNLYHLLNHLNLFGRSYLSQVQSILSRFSQ
jgi:fructosamine-3-kinase